MPLDVWTQSLLVSPPVLCGRRLLPFSLGHAVILRSISSPYAYVNVGSALSDVLTAIQICSRTTGQNRAALYGGKMPVISWVAWSMRWRGVKFDVVDASFRTYLADFTRQADRHPPKKRGRDLAAPVEFHLHRVLCEHYGYDPVAAWDVSLIVAHACADVVAESNGDELIKTPYELEQVRLEEITAAAVAAGDQAAIDQAWAAEKAFMDSMKGQG